MRKRAYVVTLVVLALCSLTQAQEPSPRPAAPAAPARPPAPAAPSRPTTPPVPARPPVPTAPEQATPPPPPPAPPAPELPRRDQPNVRFDLTIAEEGGAAAPTRKTVMLVVQGGGSASLRANTSARNSQGTFTPVPLNVDVRLANYEVSEAGKVRARIAVEYQPYVADVPVSPYPAVIRAQVDAMFLDGRKVTLWQAADPVSDRRTSIEVTATLLK